MKTPAQSNREAVITSNPDISGGTPVLRGTRVPAQSLFDHLDTGDTLEEFLEQFPSVSSEQARAALRIGHECVCGKV